MNSRDFCYWLQGYFELAGTGPMSENQVKMVQKHLNMVFYQEIDPSFGANNEELSKIHDTPPAPGLDEDKWNPQAAEPLPTPLTWKLEPMCPGIGPTGGGKLTC